MVGCDFFSISKNKLVGLDRIYSLENQRLKYDICKIVVLDENLVLSKRLRFEKMVGCDFFSISKNKLVGLDRIYSLENQRLKYDICKIQEFLTHRTRISLSMAV